MARTKDTMPTDVILPMQEPYMTQIVDGTKNYEFRKYCLKPSVERIWFYRTAPHSSIGHVCEIQPARTRNAGDTPLEEDGLGNKEYNARHKDWEGYEFAYKILSVYAIESPISLKELRNTFGVKSAPRGLVYLPQSIAGRVEWQKQKKIRADNFTHVLRNKLDALSPQIEQLCQEAGNAGLSCGILQAGEVIYTSHFGRQDVDEPQRPNDDTIFHVGSLTKALTAAGMALLVEQGKIRWDQPLREVIPGFHQRNKDVEAQATIADLLAHRMGLAMRMNYWAQMQQELLLPPEQAVNVLGSLHQIADFRTTIKYNNWTYSLAGQIIERFSRMSLEQFMQEHFFQPLGLTRTTLDAPSRDNYASCHITLSDGTPFKVPHPRIGSGTLMAGASGLKSSVSDLLKLYGAFLAAFKDQQRTGLTSTEGNPFKQTGVTLTPHNKKGATSYGFGWFLVQLPAELGWIGINDGRVAQNPIIGEGLEPTSVAYHNGGMPGILASVHLIPERGVAVVVLGNTLAFADVPDYVGSLFINTILGVERSPDFVSLVKEARRISIEAPRKTIAKLKKDRKLGTLHKPLPTYEGRFINAERNFFLDVRIHGDGLRMRLQGLPETYYDLTHYHDDVFAWECDRDAEAKRAMFPQLSDAFRKVHFISDKEGNIGSIHWAYARDELDGEMFHKFIA